MTDPITPQEARFIGDALGKAAAPNGGNGIIPPVVIHSTRPDAPLSARDLALAKAIAAHVREATAPLRARLQVLEDANWPRVIGESLADVKHETLAPLAARLAALETQASKYKGVWGAGQAYGPGDTVTHGGVLWHCESSNNVGERPGEGRTGWVLMHKSAKGQAR